MQRATPIIFPPKNKKITVQKLISLVSNLPPWLKLIYWKWPPEVSYSLLSPSLFIATLPSSLLLFLPPSLSLSVSPSLSPWETDGLWVESSRPLLLCLWREATASTVLKQHQQAPTPIFLMSFREEATSFQLIKISKYLFCFILFCFVFTLECLSLPSRIGLHKNWSNDFQVLVLIVGKKSRILGSKIPDLSQNKEISFSILRNFFPKKQDSGKKKIC